jgi:predicted pyridoxine 5'-phosphate oxidase superfamily flavin-nucleotide-binding protein
MSSQYGSIAFTNAVDAEQELYGSADFYRRRSGADPAAAKDALGAREKQFLESRDSFYLATVSETGWPYVQFRGGPAGFVHVRDENTMAWADYRGNLQHISTGNLRTNDRVAIIAMDYPTRRRLKIFGTARVDRYEDNPKLVDELHNRDEADAVVERAITVTVNAFDWNCPQHITPRFTIDEVEEATAPLRARIAALEKSNAKLERDLAAR